MKLISRTPYTPTFKNVYDIEVKHNHNYCITESNIVVHNSGKGFVKENLLAMHGIKFDVDELKSAAIKSNKLASEIKTRTGHDIKNFDLRNPDNVGTLHDIINNEMGLVDKNQQTKFRGVLAAHPDRKPNLIFDVTLKGMSKLESIARNVQKLGYKKENISIVWVVNKMSVAMDQNLERPRRVPEEILADTHLGASQTMLNILNMGEKLKKYMDGDIYLAFNQRGVDSNVKSSKLGKGEKTAGGTTGKGGFYVVDAEYLKVKSKGKPQKAAKQLSDEILNKIRDYTPHSDNW